MSREEAGILAMSEVGFARLLADAHFWNRGRVRKTTPPGTDRPEPGLRRGQTLRPID